MKGDRVLFNIIEVSNLTKSYSGKIVVDNLSFNVKKGETFALLGHNGAGKSTSLDCILGLKKFDKGKVIILGMNPIEDRKKLYEKVGVQLQSSSYQEKIKVVELCQEISTLYKEVDDYNDLLKRFLLYDMRNQYVSTLSGGEKQKLAIVLALLLKPEIVFLDELTTGLDVEARRLIWKELLRLKKLGLTIILTSHYMDEVEVLCDKIYIMKNGKKLVAGTLEEVISSSPYQKLEDAYLWHMERKDI